MGKLSLDIQLHATLDRARLEAAIDAIARDTVVPARTPPPALAALASPLATSAWRSFEGLAADQARCEAIHARARALGASPGAIAAFDAAVWTYAATTPHANHAVWAYQWERALHSLRQGEGFPALPGAEETPAQRRR